MKPILSTVVVGFLLFTWIALEAHEPVRAIGLSGNVRARFIGARRSPARGSNIVAKFQAVEKANLQTVPSVIRS